MYAHIVVYTEGSIHGTTHLAVLVAFPQLDSTWRITQLGGLGEQLGSIFEIDEQDVLNPPFVQECKLV